MLVFPEKNPSSPPCQEVIGLPNQFLDKSGCHPSQSLTARNSPEQLPSNPILVGKAAYVFQLPTHFSGEFHSLLNIGCVVRRHDFRLVKRWPSLEPGLMEVWVSFALCWGRFSQAFETSLTGTGTLEKESWCTCYIYIFFFFEIQIQCLILCSRGTLFRHFAHTWINWWPGYHIWGICLWLPSGIQVF